MFRRYPFSKTLFSLISLSLIFSFMAYGSPTVTDISGAWENVSHMIKFIESGDASSTDHAGNRALTAIEKAIDTEKDSGKRDKLRDARTQIREAMNHANKGEWPYAEGAAKRALKLIDEAR